jgi:hypothetical protein
MTSRKTIQFNSEGTVCEADLYLPEGFDGVRQFPALVIGHGFTVARSSLVEEGRLFSEAGFVCLAIDYRHFGTSQGQPHGRLRLPRADNRSGHRLLPRTSLTHHSIACANTVKGPKHG